MNSIAWAPQEAGAILACASADGKVSTVSQTAEGQWESSAPFSAHSIGCNAVSWAPAISPTLGSTAAVAPAAVKRIATGGCDNLVKIWRCGRRGQRMIGGAPAPHDSLEQACQPRGRPRQSRYRDDERQWALETVLEDGHQDWVRDVAWAPSIGLPVTTLATCSQVSRRVRETPAHVRPHPPVKHSHGVSALLARDATVGGACASPGQAGAHLEQGARRRAMDQGLRAQ